MKNRTPTNRPLIMDATTSYDLTRAEVEDLIKKALNYSDAIIVWDVTNRGQVRGATVKVRRVEIQG